MEKAILSKITGIENSIIHPLLSSLIMLDDLIHEEIDDPEKYSALLFIDQQVQRAIEFFLELRSVTMTYHEYKSGKRVKRPTEKMKKLRKEYMNIIKIIISLAISLEQLERMFI
jgi:hypothetical protein